MHVHDGFACDCRKLKNGTLVLLELLSSEIRRFFKIFRRNNQGLQLLRGQTSILQARFSQMCLYEIVALSSLHHFYSIAGVFCDL